LGDHEAAFDEVASDEVSHPPGTTTGPHQRIEVSEDLVAAEPDTEEETFDDDQIELLEEELEIVEPSSEDDDDLQPEPLELDGVDDDDGLALDALEVPGDLELSADDDDLLLSAQTLGDDLAAEAPAPIEPAQPDHLLGLDELDD